MGERPTNFGDYAERGFSAEQRGGLDWWHTCITSALIDFDRVPGFVTAFAGVANLLRHGHDADWLIGGKTLRQAIDETLRWLDAGITPAEVSLWLAAGCWNPDVAVQLAASGIRPHRLLTVDGQPAQWLEVEQGNNVPLCVAACEWGLPVAQVVHAVTGTSYEVAVAQGPRA